MWLEIYFWTHNASLSIAQVCRKKKKLWLSESIVEGDSWVGTHLWVMRDSQNLGRKQQHQDWVCIYWNACWSLLSLLSQSQGAKNQEVKFLSFSCSQLYVWILASIYRYVNGDTVLHWAAYLCGSRTRGRCPLKEYSNVHEHNDNIL